MAVVLAASVVLGLVAALEVGPELARTLNTLLNTAQIVLLAWLAHRYEQNGRERRRERRQ